MITLLLLRHAKSDWDHPELDDHDRPLNKRGLRNAPLMGKFILESCLIPQACLTSTAARARHTAFLAAQAMNTNVKIKDVVDLYDFGNGKAIERVITAHGASNSPLLLVAHNPCIQEFALSICGGGEETAMALLESKYPTCALAQIEFDLASWSALPGTKGRLIAFTTPKMLA